MGGKEFTQSSFLGELDTQIRQFEINWALVCTARVCKLIHNIVDTNSSMTQLLMHSVAHSTKPSSRPKTNNQVFKSCVQLSKSCKKLDVILENKVIQKLKLSEKYQ